MVKRHFRNASWSGFSASFRAVYGLLNALLAVRLLGVEAYGHVATLLSLFVLYLSLNSSIFTVLVVKLMAATQEGREAHRQGMLAASLMFVVVSIALLTLITVSIGLLAPGFISSGIPNSGTVIDRVVLMMGILTVVQIVTALQSAFVESAGRLDLAMKWQLVGPVLVLVSLVSMFITKQPITASSYVALLCVGAVADLGLIWMVRRSVLPLSLRTLSGRNAMPEFTVLLKSGGLLQATSFMNMFLEPLNKFLLNYFLGASAVTFYDLAMKVIWGIQNLFSAAMRVFLHIGSQDHESVGSVFTQVIRLVGVPVVILHIGGAIFLSIVARYWLSIDAAELVIFFGIATFSNLGMIYVTPLYISLIGRGDLLFIFRSQAILAGTNILVSIFLIPLLGLVGSAFGLLAATAYNASAIILRCKLRSSQLDGLSHALRDARGRYAMVFMLLLTAILWGVSSEKSIVVLSVILLSVATIAVREPIVNLLMQRLRGGV